MKILHRQEVIIPIQEPFFLVYSLAIGAMAITTRIVIPVIDVN